MAIGVVVARVVLLCWSVLLHKTLEKLQSCDLAGCGPSKYRIEIWLRKCKQAILDMISAHIFAWRFGRAKLKAAAAVAPLHTSSDIGKLYTVAREDAETLALSRVLPVHYRQQLETLGECAWLCRTPLIEAINCIQNARSSLPALRFVLWGRFGTGKTITCTQLVHWALHNGYVIVHVPSGECALEIRAQFFFGVEHFSYELDAKTARHASFNLQTRSHRHAESRRWLSTAFQAAKWTIVDQIECKF